MKRKHSDYNGDGVSKKKSRREKREKRKKHKHNKRKVRNSSSNDEAVGPLPAPANVGGSDEQQVPTNSKAFQPMTKEQWEKEQSKITRIYDQETGRHRLVRGSGEIIEEIVSKDRQKEINRKATTMDGKFYQDFAQKLFN